MEWKKAVGYTKPQAVEIGKTTVYIRKNITETEDNEGNRAWEYDECQLDHKEYEKYCSDMASPLMQAVLEGQAAAEAAAAQTLLNQAEIMATQEAQDQTLAEIVLNQMITEGV